jgi:pimeloyl-ACP methyl ester carboxylesterase
VTRGQRSRWGAAALLAGLLLAGITDQRWQPSPPHRAEWLEAQGITVRAVRSGSPPPTYVLLHGFGEHLLTWRSVFDVLARSGRVVALDLPGFGGSDKPADGYSLPTMTGWLAAFIERWTAPPVILVGHSMGGALAAALAIARPALVERLILIAPAGHSVGLGGLATDVGETRAAAIGIWEAARAFITPMHDPAWLQEPAARARYDPTLDPAFARAVARILLQFDFTGIGSRFRDIPHPTLLIWGSLDPVIPAATGDSVASLLPCRRLEVLENTLHRPHVERPDTVLALIGLFLNNPPC